MQIDSISSYRTRITQITCGVFLFGLFWVAVRSMMFGAFSTAWLVVSACVAVFLVIALNDKYWLLLPVLSVSGVSVPSLPFSGRELGCLFLVVVFFVRRALKKDTAFRFNRDLFLIVPVLVWMFGVWSLNPVGLAMFGSDTIGGRFYLDIVLGALALFVLSAIRVSERDARFLFLFLLIAQVFSLCRGVLIPKEDPDVIFTLGAEPELTTRYAFIGCASIFSLLISYWKLSSILLSPARAFLLSVLAVLVVYSGKRRAFGTILIVPLLRVYLTGKERLFALVFGLVAAVVLVFVVAGDGTAYRLPSSARRALAVIVPQYQEHGEGGISDLFRREMREQAREVIRANPWMGRKGFAMKYSETAWIQFGSGRTSMFAAHAYSGNWHSTWYAYAADFGIPCMVFWLFFVLYEMVYAFHACRIVSKGRFLPACCLYYSFLLYVDIVFSYTSGHSSITTMGNCISFGLLLAVVRGYKKEQGLSEL